jgi:tRNA (guanine-N7-)-methyltransferase
MFDFSLERPVPWATVFGNGCPVEVEIGPGRGERLLAAATACPAVNFFAIELRGGAAEAIAERAARFGLRNVRVGSVAAYHVHFPDPWPKTRHRGRRLATPVFAREVARTLASGGAVHVASDLPRLVEAFAAVLAAAGLAAVPDAVPPRGRPKSSFEQRYARQGTAYARFVLDDRRTGAPAPDEAILGR